MPNSAKMELLDVQPYSCQQIGGRGNHSPPQEGHTQRERERVRERECVCVCVTERERRRRMEEEDDEGADEGEDSKNFEEHRDTRR